MSDSHDVLPPGPYLRKYRRGQRWATVLAGLFSGIVLLLGFFFLLGGLAELRRSRVTAMTATQQIDSVVLATATNDAALVEALAERDELLALTATAEAERRDLERNQCLMALQIEALSENPPQAVLAAMTDTLNDERRLVLQLEDSITTLLPGRLIGLEELVVVASFTPGFTTRATIAAFSDSMVRVLTSSTQLTEPDVAAVWLGSPEGLGYLADLNNLAGMMMSDTLFMDAYEEGPSQGKTILVGALGVLVGALTAVCIQSC